MKKGLAPMEPDDWQVKAAAFLDQLEARPEEITKLTWDVLCDATGVTRSTLWRNRAIRLRFVELQRVHRTITRRSKTRKRRSDLEVLVAVRRENAVLKTEVDRHLANYIEIAKRLEDRGIDPVQIFAGLTVTTAAAGAVRSR